MLRVSSRINTGRPIGPYDALIAGRALARGMLLIARDTEEFALVSGLLVEDRETG